MNIDIIRKIYRVKDIENIQSKLNMLGTDRKLKFDATGFLTARLLTTIILTIVLIFTDIQNYIIPFIMIIYYNLFYFG